MFSESYLGFVVKLYYMTKYAIWRHEGGLKVKQEQYGPFDDKEKAEEKCSELNKKIDIAVGGFQVHPEE